MAARGNDPKAGRHRYGGVAIGFHWLAAMAILASMVLGLAAANLAVPGGKAGILRVHVVLGTGVLVLTLLRAAWWSLDRRPAAVEGQPAWQHRLSRAVHLLLYAVPIVAGASGIGLMILSKAAPILFLGAGRPLPRFADFPPLLVHATAAVALAALIGLHVCAAFYHQFYRRDRLLARMGIGRAHPRH